MALTQTQYNNELAGFIAQYTNRKVGYPGTSYLGECLSLMKRWFDVVAARACAPAAGGWADYYYSRFPAPLNTYLAQVAYTPGHNYNRGSLVFYAATHHGAIWLQDNGNGTHQVFEQNADPNGSAPHIANRANSRVTGILELRVTAPAATTPVKVGQHITLPPDSGTWHLYHENGPYTVAAGSWITALHPSSTSAGYTYPIVGDKGDGIYVIDSPTWGRGALYTKGSKFVIK